MSFLISLSDFHTSILITSSVLIPYSMFYFDENVKNFSLKNQNNFNDITFNFLNELGEGQYHILSYSLLYIISKFRDDKNLEDFSKTGIKTFLISGTTVLMLKYLFGRARPYMNEGPLYFKPFSPNNDFQSFPSGHTIIVFTTASHLSNYYKNKYLTILSYSLALGVGYARIYKNQHWLSDVISGAVLGIIIGDMK